MIRTAGLALRTPVVSLVLLLALCSFAMAQAPAQPQTPGGITPDIKKNNNPQTIRPAVEEFINRQIAALSGADADAQAKARQMLTQECALLEAGQNAATPVYGDVYTQVLNQRLEELAKNPSPRVRLNAAIVNATVAQATANSQLKGATLVFLADKSEAIVLWGVKAARWILPQLLMAKPPDMRLVNAIVAAVKANPKGTVGGAIALEAYDALALNIFNPAAANQLKKEMIVAVIPAMQDLLTFRITLFQRGIPPEQHAERRPMFFLTDARVWPEQTPDQKLKTIQLIANLIALAAEQAKQPGVPDRDKAELLVTIGYAARSMSVAAKLAQANALVAALLPATQLADESVARRTSAQDVIARVQPILPAIKNEKQFAAIQDPPAVIGHEQAPPPASAPTTGPVIIPGAGPLPPPGATPPAPAPAPTPAPRPTPPPGAAGPGTRPPPPPPGGAAPKAPPPGATR